MRSGQPGEGLEASRDAHRLVPNSPTGYSNLAMAEMALGRAAAAENMTRALEREPSNDMIRHNLGLLSLRSDNAAACEELLRAHVLSHPGDVPNIANYATALTMFGQRERAESLFAQLVSTYPDDAALRARLAC